LYFYPSSKGEGFITNGGFNPENTVHFIKEMSSLIIGGDEADNDCEDKNWRCIFWFGKKNFLIKKNKGPCQYLNTVQNGKNFEQKFALFRVANAQRLKRKKKLNLKVE